MQNLLNLFVWLAQKIFASHIRIWKLTKFFNPHIFWINVTLNRNCLKNKEQFPTKGCIMKLITVRVLTAWGSMLMMIIFSLRTPGHLQPYHHPPALPRTCVTWCFTGNWSTYIFLEESSILSHLFPSVHRMKTLIILYLLSAVTLPWVRRFTGLHSLRLFLLVFR